ncbi:hypothetical protein BJ165DRAFT_1524218 [Panaeolus papilionaceus]|nr:hypothetical protein BJ165DRAFT_1524218 [Panaeolus papilionaceus]
MALTKQTEPSITGAKTTGQGPHDASAGNPSKTTTKIEGMIMIDALKFVTLGMHMTVNQNPWAIAKSSLEIIAYMSIHADFSTFQHHLNLALLSEPELFNADTP